MISDVCNSVDDFEMWFEKWGNFEKIADSSFDEITRMLTAVPLLWKKYYLMLKCYCAFKLCLEQKAQLHLEDCRRETVDGMNFSDVDEYFCRMLNNKK